MAGLWVPRRCWHEERKARIQPGLATGTATALALMNTKLLYELGQHGAQANGAPLSGVWIESQHWPGVKSIALAPDVEPHPPTSRFATMSKSGALRIWTEAAGCVVFVLFDATHILTSAQICVAWLNVNSTFDATICQVYCAGLVHAVPAQAESPEFNAGGKLPLAVSSAIRFSAFVMSNPGKPKTGVV